MKGNEAEIFLRDMQEYSQLKDRVNTIFGGTMTLKDVVDSIERVSKLQKSNPFNARVLTYDEAAMWDEYRKIGTPEECRAAVEQQIPKRPTLCTSDEQTTRYTVDYRCSKCNGMFTGTGIANYCYHCGQRLDWEELT